MIITIRVQEIRSDEQLLNGEEIEIRFFFVGSFYFLWFLRLAFGVGG